jgi:hypothetical protein
MRNVRAKIANDLFDALYEANLADVSEGDFRNDLPFGAACQDSTYGHICEAIKSLGYEVEYEAFIESGDRPVLK